MKETRYLDRREFTVEAALAVLAGVTITVSGCGGGSPTSSSPPPGPGDEVGSISDNHGHTAVVRAAQLQAGNAISLSIAGTAGHNHVVDLSAAEVAQIANNQRVSKVSSTGDGHTHTVTFN